MPRNPFAQIACMRAVTYLLRVVCFSGCSYLASAFADDVSVGSLLKVAEEADRGGRFQEALVVAKQAEALLDDSQEQSELQGRVLLRLGIAQWGLGSLQDSFSNLLRAFEIFSVNEAHGLAARAASNLAGILLESGSYDLAIEYYQIAIEKHRAGESSQSALADTLGDLALAWYTFGDLEKANLYELEALEIRREINDARGLVIGLNNLGNMQWRAGDYESAHTLFQEAHRLAQALDSRLFVAGTQIALGTTTSLLGKPLQGLALFESAQEDFKLSEAPTVHAVFNGGFAQGLARVVGYEVRAIAILEDALAVMDTYERKDNYDEYLDTLIELYRRNGEFEKAWATVDRLNLWNQENNRNQMHQRAQYLEAIFGLEKVRKARDEARLSQAELEVDLAHTASTRNLVSLGALALGALAGLVYWRSRSLDIVNRRIMAQNIELSTLTEQKDHFMRIASHDLKSPLAAISNTIALSRRKLRNQGSLEDATLGQVEQTARLALESVVSFLDFEAQDSSNEAGSDTKLLIRRVVSMHQLEIEAKSLQIKVSGPALDMGIHASRVERALDNVFTNALKVSPQNALIIISTYQSDDWFCIRVEDEGAGVRQDDTAKGHGIGLTVARKLIGEFGGNISLQNRKGLSGARASIEIPVSVIIGA